MSLNTKCIDIERQRESKRKKIKAQLKTLKDEVKIKFVHIFNVQGSKMVMGFLVTKNAARLQTHFHINCRMERRMGMANGVRIFSSNMNYWPKLKWEHFRNWIRVDVQYWYRKIMQIFGAELFLVCFFGGGDGAGGEDGILHLLWVISWFIVYIVQRANYHKMFNVCSFADGQGIRHQTIGS